MITGRRKDIKDNNNYIDKIGRITHFCPECGSLYAQDINLSVECNIYILCEKELESYSLTAPILNKKCSVCNSECIQVDNRMGIIVKDLFDKGYKVHDCCEGHMYMREFIPGYTFPTIIIDGYIKSFIPSSYYNKFDITCKFNETTIKCFDVCCCPCVCMEKYEEYKTEMLELLENLVKSLPDCPFSYDTNTANCSCGCNECACCG